MRTLRGVREEETLFHSKINFFIRLIKHFIRVLWNRRCKAWDTENGSYTSHILNWIFLFCICLEIFPSFYSVLFQTVSLLSQVSYSTLPPHSYSVELLLSAFPLYEDRDVEKMIWKPTSSSPQSQVPPGPVVFHTVYWELLLCHAISHES